MRSALMNTQEANEMSKEFHDFSGKETEKL